MICDFCSYVRVSIDGLCACSNGDVHDARGVPCFEHSLRFIGAGCSERLRFLLLRATGTKPRQWCLSTTLRMTKVLYIQVQVHEDGIPSMNV